MTLEELMILFIIVEAIQMLAMVISNILSALANRKTADVLTRLMTDEKLAGTILKNGFVGMSKCLDTDTEAQEAFKNLVANVGAIAYAAAVVNVQDKVKKTIEHEIPVPKKMRWIVQLGKDIFGKKESTGSAAPSSAAVGQKSLDQL